MSAILSASGISKTFHVATRQGPVEVRALDGVSLDVYRGKSVGVIGESGSGKTTLGKVLVKLLQPDSGRLYFMGRDVTNAKGNLLREFRSSVQMIFQDPYSSLDPRMRVADLLKDFVRLRGGVWTPELLSSLLAMVRLDESVADKLPTELSGGQRQRVAIARVLALRPQVIVADEPVSSLDVSVRSQILELFSEIRRKTGVTYVFITHDVSSLPLVVDYVSVMYRGTVVERGELRSVLKEPLHPYTQALISAVPDFGKELKVAGELTPLDYEMETAVGCKYYPRCPYAMDICKKKAPLLKEFGEDRAVACYLYS